jgi:hypothetical protein
MNLDSRVEIHDLLCNLKIFSNMVRPMADVHSESIQTMTAIIEPALYSYYSLYFISITLLAAAPTSYIQLSQNYTNDNTIILLV